MTRGWPLWREPSQRTADEPPVLRIPPTLASRREPPVLGPGRCREMRWPAFSSAVSAGFGLAVGLAFKWVLAVAVPSLEPECERTDKVGWQEERSPTFVLTNVNMFVVAAPVEGFPVLSKNRVSERDRRGEAA